MKTEEIDYLDGEFQVQESEPSTVAEVTAIIGEDGVVSEAVSNLRYRNKYPRVYAAVSKAVSLSHSFPKAVTGTKELKDKTLKNIMESDNDHLRAFLAGRKDKDGNVTTPAPDGSRAILQTLFESEGTSQPLYVKGERAGGGGKVSQAAQDASNGFFAAGPEKVAAVVEQIEASVPGYKVGVDADSNATPESVARGIMALQKHLQKVAMAQATAVLGAAK